LGKLKTHYICGGPGPWAIAINICGGPGLINELFSLAIYRPCPKQIVSQKIADSDLVCPLGPGTSARHQGKIAPPHCIKFFKVGLLFRGQLISKHNAFIRVDCQIEIGGHIHVNNKLPGSSKEDLDHIKANILKEEQV